MWIFSFVKFYHSEMVFLFALQKYPHIATEHTTSARATLSAPAWSSAQHVVSLAQRGTRLYDKVQSVTKVGRQGE